MASLDKDACQSTVHCVLFPLHALRPRPRLRVTELVFSGLRGKLIQVRHAFVECDLQLHRPCRKIEHCPLGVLMSNVKDEYSELDPVVSGSLAHGEQYKAGKGTDNPQWRFGMQSQGSGEEAEVSSCPFCLALCGGRLTRRLCRLWHRKTSMPPFAPLLRDAAHGSALRHPL